LYNGEILPGFNEETVKEYKDKYPEEGMEFGISARYTQDKISNCLSANYDYINPFMVMNEIREGLDNHALIKDKEELARYHTCVELTIQELNEILKDEVREALSGDAKALERICANYIDNVMAYIRKSKIKNPFTQREEPPSEKLMRSIEEKIDVPERGIDAFRTSIAAFIGDLANKGEKFRWDSDQQLKKALKAKLFDDVKEHVKLSSLDVESAGTVQPDLQEKIDLVKKRLIDQYKYNQQSATDVLNYVGSLFAGTQSNKD